MNVATSEGVLISTLKESYWFYLIEKILSVVFYLLFYMKNCFIIFICFLQSEVSTNLYMNITAKYFFLNIDMKQEVHERKL